MLPKMICFDMDGTIADLYSVEGWLESLRQYDPTPYKEAAVMWDAVELNAILKTLIKMGVEIRIITWLSKESDSVYDAAVREAKREWLYENRIPYTHFHAVKYGATKADSIRKYLAEDEEAWLIDDNPKVRQGWHMGETIDPTEEDILEILYALLD